MAVLQERAAETAAANYLKLNTAFGTASLTADKRAAADTEAKEALSDGISSGQLEVYYQPKHDTVTGRLVGAEALVRWKHPAKGLLCPKHFLPQFEKNDLISQLDQYVWSKVCKDLRAWIDDGVPVIPISVNTAKQDYQSGDFWGRWSKSVEENAIPSELLHIEIAETVVAESEEELLHQLDFCRSRGIQVEIDDFGTGYSSLSRLNAYPIDVIKLDKSFIDNRTEKCACIIKACINMAKALNMKIIAEGVETDEQMQMLKEMDCDIVQGFYYAEPMTCEEFGSYMQNNLCEACS